MNESLFELPLVFFLQGSELKEQPRQKKVEHQFQLLTQNTFENTNLIFVT